MAARKQIRRRIRRARPIVRRTPSSSATAARVDAKESSSSDSGLMIGGAHDPAERAADQMADRVMRMPDSSAFDSSAPVQRKCDACEAEDKKLRRAPEKPDEEEQVQAKPAASAPVAAGSSAVAATPVASKAIRSMGAGKPIARTDRAFFEPRFGADLSSVRIHDGLTADRASRAINARAFTQGKNIAFAKGEFQPKTDKGRRLMAHELAHILQKEHASRPVVNRKPSDEDEMTARGRRYASRQPPPPRSRQPDPYPDCTVNPLGRHLPNLGRGHPRLGSGMTMQPCNLTEAAVRSSPNWCSDPWPHSGETCYRRIPSTAGGPSDQFCYTSTGCCHSSPDSYSPVLPTSPGAGARCTSSYWRQFRHWQRDVH